MIMPSSVLYKVYFYIWPKKYLINSLKYGPDSSSSPIILEAHAIDQLAAVVLVTTNRSVEVSGHQIG